MTNGSAKKKRRLARAKALLLLFSCLEATTPLWKCPGGSGRRERCARGSCRGSAAAATVCFQTRLCFGRTSPGCPGQRRPGPTSAWHCWSWPSSGTYACGSGPGVVLRPRAAVSYVCCLEDCTLRARHARAAGLVLAAGAGSLLFRL